MKYMLLVDSVAALPDSVFDVRPIKLMPIVINLDGEVMADDISEKELAAIYAKGNLSVGSEISTAPPTPSQIRDLILEEVVPHVDHVICLTLSKTTSPVYENVESVASSITKEAREVRDKLGIETPFRMTAINTGTTIAGEGLVALYADMLLTRGADTRKYPQSIEKFTQVARTYVIVRDLLYSRQRAKEKGIKTVSMGAALVGKAVGATPIVEITRDNTVPIATKRGFDSAVESLIEHCIDMIEEGLYFNFINVSYAGDLTDLNKMDAIKKLKSIASLHKVKVLFSVMGLASGTVYGAGGFAIGIAAKNQAVRPS